MEGQIILTWLNTCIMSINFILILWCSINTYRESNCKNNISTRPKGSCSSLHVWTRNTFYKTAKSIVPFHIFLPNFKREVWSWKVYSVTVILTFSQIWEGKTFRFTNGFFENLQVLRKLLTGYQGQDQGSRGHGLIGQLCIIPDFLIFFIFR